MYNPSPFSRRELLSRCGMGFGALGLAALLGDAGLLTGVARGQAAADAINPLAPRLSHFPTRAKRVVHFFLNGGPSHVDIFDPKPALEKFKGQPMPGGNLKTERKTAGAMPSPWASAKHWPDLSTDRSRLPPR